MFERGTKYNNDECELNASSIGMAKAALESMNGFNLYGDNGCSWYASKFKKIKKKFFNSKIKKKGP